jgi:hypothetical protein
MHRVAVLRLRTVLPTDWNYLKCRDQFLGAGFGLLVGNFAQPRPGSFMITVAVAAFQTDKSFCRRSHLRAQRYLRKETRASRGAHWLLIASAPA